MCCCQDPFVADDGTTAEVSHTIEQGHLPSEVLDINTAAADDAVVERNWKKRDIINDKNEYLINYC